MYAKSERSREDAARREARRQGCALRKSRIQTPNLDNHGGWMIIDPWQNAIVAGERFDLDLDDVERWLAE
jgi:hypothetical protein